jgi:hypothetical protein
MWSGSGPRRKRWLGYVITLAAPFARLFERISRLRI